MQSVISRIFCACLRAVFHSPFMDNAHMSDKAGKKTKDIKSHYKPSKDFTFSRQQCNNCYYETLKNSNCKTDKVILLIHGGSFKVKLIDTYRKIAEKYSNLLDGATVISVDYRTFPQYEHPAQLYDVRDVCLELLNQGIKPENIIFIGDSAGANLAVTTTLWLRDNGYPLPSQIVCFSLWADMTSSGELRVKMPILTRLAELQKTSQLKKIGIIFTEFLLMPKTLTEQALMCHLFLQILQIFRLLRLFAVVLKWTKATTTEFMKN